jgi:hypothetical protein
LNLFPSLPATPKVLDPNETLYIPSGHHLPLLPGIPPVTWTMVDKRNYDPNEWFRIAAGEVADIWSGDRYIYAVIKFWGVWWGPCWGEAYETPDLNAELVYSVNLHASRSI